MVEVTNELMDEVLRRIPPRPDKVDAQLNQIRQEIASIRLTVPGMQNNIHNIYGILARNEERLDRLDLREVAEPQRPYEPQ